MSALEQYARENAALRAEVEFLNSFTCGADEVRALRARVAVLTEALERIIERDTAHEDDLAKARAALARPASEAGLRCCVRVGPDFDHAPDCPARPKNSRSE